MGFPDLPMGSGGFHMPPGTWACVQQLPSPCSTARETTSVGSPHTLTKSRPCSQQREDACTQQQRPSAAKNKMSEKNQLKIKNVIDPLKQFLTPNTYGALSLAKQFFGALYI